METAFLIWTIVVLSIVGVGLCAFVLRGWHINSQLDELIEERKAAREEARHIARENEELRHAAE